MNIAIVGGGNGGVNIIKSFSNISDVHIMVVVDRNPDAPGMVLARELGISCSTSIDDIMFSEIDLVIEVTGSEKVAALISEKCSGKCKIIDSQGARLIMSLVQRDIETLEKLNNQVEAIDIAAMTVQKQSVEIKDSIDGLHSIITNLTEFAKVSDSYINQSDEIVQYVNNIAQQSKILGINATIEAARAGENGRAFGVVAKEIQKLANDSQSNSKTIKDILTKLSEEIKNISMVVGQLQELSEMQKQASDNMDGAMNSLMGNSRKS